MLTQVWYNTQLRVYCVISLCSVKYLIARKRLFIVIPDNILSSSLLIQITLCSFCKYKNAANTFWHCFDRVLFLMLSGRLLNKSLGFIFFFLSSYVCTSRATRGSGHHVPARDICDKVLQDVLHRIPINVSHQYTPYDAPAGCRDFRITYM